jgi:hypothetical protein
MKWYQLGELVLNCPKVNYKLNYKPGQLICPRTKKMVYFDDVKHKLEKYARMPIKYKHEVLQHCSLVDLPESARTEGEILAELLKEKVHRFPFLYENKSYLLIDHLQEAGKKHIIPFILQMVLHLGLDRLQEMVLELKFEPKKIEENEAQNNN